MNQENQENDNVVPMDPVKEEPKKLTKAQQKKADKEKKAEEKRQAEAQRKAMEGQIESMHKAVQSSKCKTCMHCLNRGTKIDRFEVKSSRGEELFTPMNFCTMAGLSLVDVQECEMYIKHKE